MRVGAKLRQQGGELGLGVHAEELYRERTEHSPSVFGIPIEHASLCAPVCIGKSEGDAEGSARLLRQLLDHDGLFHDRGEANARETAPLRVQ